MGVVFTCVQFLCDLLEFISLSIKFNINNATILMNNYLKSNLKEKKHLFIDTKSNNPHLFKHFVTFYKCDPLYENLTYDAKTFF